MSSEPILVTRPFLPPLEELLPFLEQIWDSRWLTNHGPLHRQFERELSRFLAVDYISLTANGMLALEAAIHASGSQGEVITTPYSFVATSHAVKRSGLTPVFVDVRDDDLNINPDLIEARITPRTSAIVAVHCYGNPCDNERLRAIADKHGLKLIYDAAHAFGVRKMGQSVVAFGDFSIVSFHATKTFNTFEGGAVISSSLSSKEAVEHISNFGIADELTVKAVGGNSKMNEFSAALGLVQLSHYESVRAARQNVDAQYRAAFEGVHGIRMLYPAVDVTPNYSYFPILIGEEYPISRDELYDKLKSNGIFSRRYFYPLLSNLPMYRELDSARPSELRVANRAADQILCLPIYHDLKTQDQQRVIDIICH